MSEKRFRPGLGCVRSWVQCPGEGRKGKWEEGWEEGGRERKERGGGGKVKERVRSDLHYTFKFLMCSIYILTVLAPTGKFRNSL